MASPAPPCDVTVRFGADVFAHNRELVNVPVKAGKRSGRLRGGGSIHLAWGSPYLGKFTWVGRGTNLILQPVFGCIDRLKLQEGFFKGSVQEKPSFLLSSLKAFCKMDVCPMISVWPTGLQELSKMPLNPKSKSLEASYFRRCRDVIRIFSTEVKQTGH